MSQLKNSPKGSLKRRQQRRQPKSITAPNMRPATAQSYTALSASSGSALLDSFAQSAEDPEAFMTHVTLVPAIALRSSFGLAPIPQLSPQQRDWQNPAVRSASPQPPAQVVPPQPPQSASPELVARARAKQSLKAQISQRIATPASDATQGSHISQATSPQATPRLASPLPVQPVSRRPQPPATPQPVRPQPASYQPASTQVVNRPGASHQVRVYGGSSYKALQAKAAAGGLVNLDDSLLFGGTDKDPRQKSVAHQSSHSLEPDFLGYLGSEIEDFTASPIKGGLHYTAHIDDDKAASRLSQEASMRTVLDIAAFKLGDLMDEEMVEPAESRVDTLDSVDGGTAELVDLSAQITQLNQRIEYLSKKLSELTAIEPFEVNNEASRRSAYAASNGQSSSNGHANGSSGRRPSTFNRNRNPVVLDIKTIQLSESVQIVEKRVATLGPSFQMT